MPHSYTHLLYHVVFATKDRRPWLDADIRSRVHEFLGGGVRAQGGVALAVGGTADHVHLFVKLRQDRAVADAIRDLRAKSSGWIHNTFAGHAGFAWQGGYGAFAVSESQSEAVRRYIARQEEHHKVCTFEEEFVGLLKAHGVEFDERYLFA